MWSYFLNYTINFMAFKNKRKKRSFKKRSKPEFEQKLLDLARVTRVVKGGRRFSFRATVVIGNRRGKVGVGVGKGTDVSNAIQKGVADAKKHIINIKLTNGTISHDIIKKTGSAKVLLKPAPAGRGIIAGGAVRIVLDLLGVKDIVSKSFGTSNKLNVARGTVEALKKISIPTSKDENSSKEEDKTQKISKKKKETGKVSKSKKEKVEVDDLTKIEGIGPKISEIFAKNGIKTFKDLSLAKKQDLIKILSENKLSNHDPSTWSKQASLAFEGKFDELKALQDELNGGK